jgi:hypothetical protein
MAHKVPASRPGRFALILIVAAIFEAIWTFFLGWRLPRHYIANHWDAAWVGIDVGEIILLMACAWAAWRRRAILILFAPMVATLLLIDAWFDVTTARRGAIGQSWLLALGLEVPAAIFFFWITGRSVRQLVHSRYVDNVLEGVPLHQLPLPPFNEE